MSNRKQPVIMILLMFVMAVAVSAQNPDELFVPSVSLTQEEMPQGGSTIVEYTLEITADHFVYPEMTKIEVETPAGIQAGRPVLPGTMQKLDPVSQQMKDVYVGTVRFQIPITAALMLHWGHMKSLYIPPIRAAHPQSVTFRYGNPLHSI